jgi:hypothetical protein
MTTSYQLKEHPAVIHPMQYELESAYHAQCQRAAAGQRLANEAEQQMLACKTPLAHFFRAAAARFYSYLLTKHQPWTTLSMSD